MTVLASWLVVLLIFFTLALFCLFVGAVLNFIEDQGASL
jgi:hypothetical protein